MHCLEDFRKYFFEIILTDVFENFLLYDIATYIYIYIYIYILFHLVLMSLCSLLISSDQG